jgi:predicted RNA-binding Zn-ribbon protein involved in translation (DUF1610 family)
MVALLPASLTPARTRPWRCPQCGTAMGHIAYARRKPPVLYPSLPAVVCISVRGGVAVFACPVCAAQVEWRMETVRTTGDVLASWT